ncbi:unnamed protein product [Candidula unifasciata]|uniref:Uncharacterized protein n=1 Tax=Candidula unifasciata TaxID=100452 RepID=A0A8S3Z4Y0_9EUPU|nr:unnamed protein product [Candidula unifasciata]
MSLTLRYVILLAVTAVSGQDDVIMSLSYEGSNDYVIDFKFTSNVFKSLYQCLCTDNSLKCNIEYDYNHVMQGVNSEITKTTYPPPCKLYTCTNSRQFPRVTCVTLQQTDSCTRQVKPTFVGIDLASSCATSCVGIVWSLSKEGIRFNDKQLRVRQCGDQCCPGPASEKPPQPQNESSSDHLVISETFSEREYRDTYIVAGIAAGVVLIAILVFVIFVFLKPRSTSYNGQREAANTPQSSTNETNHSFYHNTATINDVSTHTTDTGKATSNTFQPLSPFAGLQISKQILGHENNGSEDFWNSLALNRNTNTAAGSESVFEKKPNKQVGFSDAISEDNAEEHNFEADYAEIDDYSIQDCSPVEYIPDCSDIDLNDGYSTVENSDYYNIQDNTPGSADGKSSDSREDSADFSTPRAGSLSTDGKTGMQTTGHQTSHVLGQNQNVSEYFVARPISSEVPTYSVGQQIDGTSRDPGISFEQEQDNSNTDTAEKKRTSYFILEKDTEEEDI